MGANIVTKNRKITTATTTNLTGVITGNGSVIGSKANPTGDIVGTTDTQTLTNKTIDGDLNTVQDLPYSAIKSTSRSGLDTSIITGTANTTNLGLTQWNSDGDLVDSLIKPEAITSGWISAGETWTYASADDPTFTFTVASDVTTKYSAGMKIKLTQGTVKYFIITAVSAFSGGNTTITVYGGTDYDLANSAISANAYSMMRTPAGFPMSPAKWSVTVSSSSTTQQTDPTATVWYNLGGNIVVPVGVWSLSYQAPLYLQTASANQYLNAYCTLSTGNNSESDTQLTGWAGAGDTTADSKSARGFISRQKYLELASKTTYYLNAKTISSNVTALQIASATGGDTVIRATCAYL